MDRMNVLLVVTLAVVCFRSCDTTMFTMLSHDQQYIVDAGAQLSLRCEFYMDQFNLFINPVQWKKTQYGEMLELNMLGNVKEPYESTGRFLVTYDPSPPRYIMGLTIRNMSHVDSGNYTCDVTGPKSTELGIVRYSVFVKAPVEEVTIVRGTGSSSTHASSIATVTFVENEPTPVRCIARGGSPPPEMEISMGRDDYTKYFRFDSVPTVSGVVGFRTLRMTTMLITDHFRASARDDGSKLNCIAQVPGLTKMVESILITVNYAPRIECQPSTAYIGDRNIRVTCDVTARPPVTSWQWIVDENGTSLSEGESANGFWTIVTNLEGKMHLQLYFREAKEDSFRDYTLSAKNKVAKRSADVALKRRYREAESNPHASTEKKPPYRKPLTSGRSNRDPSSLIAGSSSLGSNYVIQCLFICVTLYLH